MALYRMSSAPPSSSFCVNVFILLLWCGLLVTSVIGGNNETDRSALLEFKAKIIHDPLGALSLEWQHPLLPMARITCGCRHQRVTVLDLQSLKLVGSISPYIGNLSFLRNLTLQNNSFHNEIPLELGRLQRIQFLQLQNNTLSGKIPSNLSNCTNIIVLRVSFNDLSEEIPTNLGTLTKLQYFAIQKNNMIGCIPPSL